MFAASLLLEKNPEYLGFRSQYILFPVSTVLYKVQCDHDNNVLDFQMKMLKGVKTNERNKRLGAWTRDWFYGNIRDLQIKPKRSELIIKCLLNHEPFQLIILNVSKHFSLIMYLCPHAGFNKKREGKTCTLNRYKRATSSLPHLSLTGLQSDRFTVSSLISLHCAIYFGPQSNPEKHLCNPIWIHYVRDNVQWPVVQNKPQQCDQDKKSSLCDNIINK